MAQPFIPSGVMADFMLSDKYVRVLAGPVGAGKSVCCVHELLRMATLQAADSRKRRRTRYLIVRNTADQLRLTTWKTIQEWIPPGVAGAWYPSRKTFDIRFALPDGTMVESEWILLALDTPDDVRKALSLEATGLWGNEARELHSEVVDGLLARIKRFPPMVHGGPTRAGAIFDTNMPDMDTWWHQTMMEPPSNWSVHVQPPAIYDFGEFMAALGREPDDEDPVERPIEGIEGTVWHINPGSDNLQHLDPTYYHDLIPGKSMDWLDVYLRARYGRSLSGVPVYERTFNPRIHLAEKPFEPVKSLSYPVTVGVDFGRTPAAVFVQLDHRGRVVVLSEMTAKNMGIDTFITTCLRPHIYERYAGCSLLFAPDPSGFFKQQIGEVSMVDILKKEGWKVEKPPTQDPEKRIQAVERLLTRPGMFDGKGAFQVNPDCEMLIKGFRYGYRYKLKRSGDQEDKPDKASEFSHVHDALQYAAAVIDLNVSGYTVRRARRTTLPPRVSAAGWT